MREMAFRRTGEREPVSGQERGVMNMLIDQRWTGIRSIAKWSSKNGREKSQTGEEGEGERERERRQKRE